MLSSERKTFLLSMLDTDGRVVAKAAAAQLGVSEDSIRRDLRELADLGACIRVYGGALPPGKAEAPVSEREDISPASKRRVARRALGLIEDGDTIVVDGGTTALALAGLLPERRALTVITPSPRVALSLAEHSEAKVVMIGGELSRRSLVNGGPIAVEAAKSITADAFFLGAAGVDPVHGLTTGTIDDAATKRALAARSARVYVLASDDKVGVASRVSILPLEEVTGILFDPEDSNPAIGRFDALLGHAHDVSQNEADA